MIEILYQDADLLVCIKPSGIRSTDEPGGLPSLIRQTLGDPKADVRTVHRLDQVVSGLMVLARNARTASALSRLVREGRFFKLYHAVIHSRPFSLNGTMTDLLLRNKEERKTYVVTEPGKNVQEASLSYRVLAYNDKMSKVGILLHTGRTHQIRCQFASRGMPLVGDRKYGLPDDEGPIALWSHTLSFRHPTTGEFMSFSREPPKIEPWIQLANRDTFLKEDHLMFDAIAIGESLIDFTCKSTDEQGYPTMEAHPGGAPANFLAAINRFGGKVAMLGKVGDDAFGHLLLGTLQQAGICTDGILVDPTVFTTLAFVTLDEHGDREFSFARKPGADTCIARKEVRIDLLSQTRALHFGSLSLTDEPARSATQFAVGFAKDQGKLISFDPNLRRPLWADLELAKEQMLWGLSRADVVKISEEEVEFLFGITDPAAGAAKIRQDYNVRLVFVTLGADGCWFDNGTACGHVDSLKGITVRDTTGAGDIFGGSALWKLLQTRKAPEALTEQELREIVTFACTAAGLSTTRPGGISSVPSPQEVAALL